MKIKNVCLILLPLFILFSFTSCNSNKYTDEEIYGARAAYTISRHLGEATSFVISYIEYDDDGDNKKITADCALYYTGTNFERYVFWVGTGKYFEDKTAAGNGIYDEETGLYMLNFGDTLLNRSDDRKLNEKNILKIFNAFLKNGDKALLGIE